MHLDVGSAETLASHHVALVVVGAPGVAVTSLAAVRVRLRQPVVLRQTLVTVPDPRHVGLAGALSRLLIAAPAIIQSAQGATRALLTTVRILNSEVPVT